MLTRVPDLFSLSQITLLFVEPYIQFGYVILEAAEDVVLGLADVL